jgi:hypothetical protein
MHILLFSSDLMHILLFSSDRSLVGLVFWRSGNGFQGFAGRAALYWLVALE